MRDVAVRHKRAALASVEYRAGVHFVGTVLWCDALHAREVCFVSSARARGSRRHGQVIATARTAALLAPAGQTTLAGALVTPVARPFALGRARLELFSSGATLGAASLQVDQGDRRFIYAGDVAVRPSRLAEVGELRRCDVLVLGARVARPLPPRAAVEAELAAYVARALAAEETPVVVAAPHGDAEEAALALATAGFTLTAQAQIAESLKRWRALGAAVPAVRKLRKTPRPGEVLLWPLPAPPTRRTPAGPPLAELLSQQGIARPRLAVLTGALPSLAPCSESFAWAQTADPDELVRYAVATGARELYLTDAHAEPVAAALRAAGLDARSLGPPEQMSLF